MLRETTAAMLVLWASGCLSASEGGSGGDGDGGAVGGDSGGDLTDAGLIDPVFQDCPPDSVGYWGGSVGDFDGDSMPDLLLLRDSIDSELRGIELRLGADGARTCAFTPALHMRGARAGDFYPGGDPIDDVLLLAFDDANRRHVIILTGGAGAPVVEVEQIEPGVEPGFTIYDPYVTDAFDGPSGWQVIYGGPSAALSDGSLEAAPGLHALEGPGGEAIGDVLAVALVEIVGDELRALVATTSALYWYDALAILTDGPVRAEEELLLDGPLTAAGFGDFEAGDGDDDGCLDLAVARTLPTPAVKAYDLTCEPNAITLSLARDYIPGALGAGMAGLLLTSGNMDMDPRDEIVLLGLSNAGALFYDARTDVAFDEDGSVSFECGDDDLASELCGQAQVTSSLSFEVDWVRAIRGDVDGDDAEDLVFVGEDDLVGCISRSGDVFGACL